MDSDRPVLSVWWCHLDPAGMPRGYWDQQIVEDLLANRWWQTGLVFDRDAYVGHVGPASGGAVVVLPARSHYGREEELERALAPLTWVMLIIVGDEERKFRWADVKHPRMRVWVQTPEPMDHGADGFLPVGWSPPVRAWLDRHGDPDDNARTIAWAFLGQASHERRRDCVAALAKIGSTLGAHVLAPTAGFLQGVDPEQYVATMAATRVAPCPSGPETVDTFRASEALELGCVPLLDLRTPKDTEEHYWSMVAGEVTACPTIDHEWSAVSGRIWTVLQRDETWEQQAIRVRSWWCNAKARMAELFATQVRDLAGIPDEVDDLVTAVVSVSPIESHPDPSIVLDTIASIRWHLPRAKIVLACDGVRPEQQELAARYRRHLLELLRVARCNDPAHNVVVYASSAWRHQAGTVRHALDHVRTPLVLFAEHDTPLAEAPIHWRELVAAVFHGRANVVRFHHEAAVHPEHRWLMVDLERVDLDGAPVMQTMQWSQRPHLAETGFYRLMLRGYFGESARTMIEDTMHGVLDFAWREHGRAGADRWRVFLYAPEGSMVRSMHLDGRGSASKYEMVYEYPNNDQVPEGAPAPTSRRTD